MALTVTDMRSRLDGMRGQKTLLIRQIAAETKRAKDLAVEQDQAEKAKAIITKAAIETQENLRMHLSAVVTTALRATFPERDFAFSVTFETKAGRTECLLEIEEDGIRSDPLDCEAGGLVDVCSFALRCTFWSIHKTRPVMVLDEPFHFVSPALKPKAAEMIRQIAKKLGLQIIMVTHIPEFTDVADAVFNVEYNRGVSKVTQ